MLLTTDHYQIVSAPYEYLTSLPGKGVRNQFIDTLNIWLQVPVELTNKIKNVVNMLHGGSLM